MADYNRLFAQPVPVASYQSENCRYADRTGLHVQYRWHFSGRILIAAQYFTRRFNQERFYSHGPDAVFSLQYLSVVLFSIISGLIPPTVFALSLSQAPRPDTTAASIGLILQVSALAQFLIPPLAAALVSRTQHWADIVWVSSLLSLCGVMVAGWLFRAYPSRAAKPKQP